MMKINTKIGIAALAIATILFAGCENKNESIADNAPVAIRIVTNIHPAGASRATGTTWATTDRIGVSANSAEGATAATNIQYAATGTDGAFTVVNAPGEDNNIYFLDTKPVSFTAYYPYAGRNGTRPGTDGLIEMSITSADQKEAGQPGIDCLWSSAGGVTSARPQVKFDFRHCMSRIVFTFLPGNGLSTLDDLEYTLVGITERGAFNTLTGEAKATDAVATTPTGYTLTVPYHASGMSSSLIVFPQQGDKKITMRVSMQGQTYDAEFQLPKNTQNGNVRELAGGRTYKYHVTMNKVKMTVIPSSITDWVAGGDEAIRSIY